jgi:adenylate cyclase
LTLGLLWGSMAIKQETGQMADILRWSQLGIDIAGGDPVRANFLAGSPLSLALVFRGYSRALLGLPGWREDIDDALAMAHDHDLLTFAGVVAYKYAPVIQQGLLVLDDDALGELEEAYEVALELGDHNALGLTKYALGAALLETRSDIERGVQMLGEIREMCDRRQFFRTELPNLDLLDAREDAVNGYPEKALPVMRAAIDTLFDNGQLTVTTWATSVLVAALLEHGDVAEAETAIDRLAAAPIADLVVRDLTLLRLRALLAKACGDEAAYRDYRDRYRAMANELGFEGHMASAEAMT